MSNFTDKRFSFATFMVIYLFQVAGIGFFLLAIAWIIRSVSYCYQHLSTAYYLSNRLLFYQ